MVKTLLFLDRAATASSREFGASWRALAKRLQRSRPANQRPRRLEHCVVRDGPYGGPWRGIALAWFDDETGAASYRKALTAQLGSAGMGSAEEAQRVTMVSVEERCAFGCDWLEARRLVRDGPPALLLIGFVARARGLSRMQFRDYWWENHRPLANSLVPGELQPVAYVHDYVLCDDEFGWDGIGEMYETSMENAKARAAWFESEAANPLERDEERFLVRETRKVIVTDHEILV